MKPRRPPPPKASQARRPTHALALEHRKRLTQIEMASSAWEADEQQAEWYTRQIAMFAQQKQLQKAVDTYQQLVDAGLRPTSYTFSALINAYVLAGDVSGGERVMSEMRAAGCVPNVVTYTTLLKGHCAVGDLDAASALLLQMTTSTPPVKADLRACNTFLRGASRRTYVHVAPCHAHTPPPPRQAASAWAIYVRRAGSGACCQAGAWCLTTWPASTRHDSARRASSSASCARCCATYRRPATLTMRAHHAHHARTPRSPCPHHAHTIAHTTTPRTHDAYTMPTLCTHHARTVRSFGHAVGCGYRAARVGNDANGSSCMSNGFRAHAPTVHAHSHAERYEHLRRGSEPTPRPTYPEM